MAGELLPVLSVPNTLKRIIHTTSAKHFKAFQDVKNENEFILIPRQWLSCVGRHLSASLALALPKHFASKSPVMNQVPVRLNIPPSLPFNLELIRLAI